MKPIYTAEAIQKLLGAHYRVKPTSRRGFQVNLVLKGEDGVAINDYTKTIRNLAAFEKLKAAGYAVREEDFRISSPPQGRDGVWTPWCSIFVNEPVAAETNAGGEMMALLKKLAKNGVDVNALLRDDEAPQVATTVTPETPTADGVVEDETPPV